MDDLSATKNEDVGLIVRVQLVSKIFNICGHDPPTSQTHGQTDRQTTCDLKTAFCTMHHALKSGRMCVHVCIWAAVIAGFFALLFLLICHMITSHILNCI